MTKYHKQTGLAAFVMAAALGVSAGHALDAQITADAEMRIGPGANFPIVGSVPGDEDVRVNGCTGGEGWCVVRYNGRHGWVSSASVNVTGISRSRNKFDDPIIVISVAEQPGRRVFRDASAAVPMIVEQEEGVTGTERRIYRSGVGIGPSVPPAAADFTVFPAK